MNDCIRAYAKIVGPGWEYYMTKPKIILGRGGRDIECDVKISSENAVSRQHFTIRFAPELQAFEVENLSKNGILVNGQFVHRLTPPVLLRSQADIAFGRCDPMHISFLLPVGPKNSIKKREYAADRHVPLLQWVGQQIVQANFLTARDIRRKIEGAHPQQLRKLGSDAVVDSSIRQILMQNEHIFYVMDSLQIENRDGNDAGPVKDAYFAVRDEQKSRFFQYANELDLMMNRTGNGTVNAVANGVEG